MLNLDEIKSEPFEFTLGGVAYSIPALDDINAAPVVALLESDAPVTKADAANLFRSVLREHAPGALEKMTVSQLGAITREYMQTGDLGESSPSSD